MVEKTLLDHQSHGRPMDSDLQRDPRQLSEALLAISRLTTEQDLFRKLRHEVSLAVDATYFALGLLTETRTELELRVAVDGHESTERRLFVPGDDPISLAIESGKGSLVGTLDDIDEEILQVECTGTDRAQSLVTVPISVGNNIIGAMSVQTPLRHAYGTKELTLLSTIALHAGVAIENSRLYQTARKRGDRRAAVLDEVIHRHESEQKALVDDIHNNTLQTLAVCLYGLDHAQKMLEADANRDALVQQLQEVREQLAENIDDLRKRIFRLRPATLDGLGLEPALRELLNQAQEDLDLDGELDVELPRRLPAHLESAVYRIVQEALYHLQLKPETTMLNVGVHGSESDVTITLRGGSAAPLLATRDRSGGDDEPDVRLLTLIERAELAGGRVDSTHNSDGAVALRITLPRTDVPGGRTNAIGAEGR